MVHLILLCGGRALDQQVPQGCSTAIDAVPAQLQFRTGLLATHKFYTYVLLSGGQNLFYGGQVGGWFNP